MGALGHVEWFDDESLFSVASALTAAAPAFLFRFLDALAAAGEELGLPADQAARLAAAMAEGAERARRRGRRRLRRSSPAASPAPAARPRPASRCSTPRTALRALVLRTLEASRRRGQEMAATAPAKRPMNGT